MVITVLPVPPPQVRPSIQMESSQGRGEDDLTVKLQARVAARLAGSGWRVVKSAGGGVTAAWEAEAWDWREKAAETVMGGCAEQAAARGTPPTPRARLRV